MVSLVVQLYLDDFVSLVVKFLVNIFPFSIIGYMLPGLTVLWVFSVLE